MKKFIILIFLLSSCSFFPSQEVIDGQVKATTEQQVKDKEQERIEKATWAQLEYQRYLDFSRGLATFITLVSLGLGAGAIVFFTIGGYWSAQWIHTKATTLYPNGNNMLPMVITRGLGYENVKNPNIQLHSNSTLQLPTISDEVIRLSHPSASKPEELQKVSEASQLLITGQNQFAILARNVSDPISRKAIEKALLSGKLTQAELPFYPDAITAEVRPVRTFNIIDKTGTITL